MAKQLTAKEQYLKDIEQAQIDFGVTLESTEEMIDMPFFEFAKFIEGKNIGVLKAFRTLLQFHLDKVDVHGKTLVENKLTSFDKEARIVVGSVFSLSARIQDRMGYIDYVIQKNSVKW